ncbi:MAG TPA: HIG1 domain-containing protein [Steroidobacteraceae bacterium]|jgi:Hypoxia induced protein conserved region.|nr:HIG1 domain-containing protein [Steroidobacteraceae bacterium]
MDPMTMLLLAALAATVLALFTGLLSMSGGEAVDNQFSEPLMWARVGLQGLTIVLLLVAVLLR